MLMTKNELDSKFCFCIFGTHGSGKTTLAKKILKSFGELETIKTKYGCYTKVKDKNIVGIGKYTTDCGGCDSIIPYKNVENLFYYLIKKDYKIVIEGIIFSSLFGRTVRMLLNAQEKGYNVSINFIPITEGKSYERVLKRNGGKPVNIKNIKAKAKAVLKNYIKIKTLQLFNCREIYNENN